MPTRRARRRTTCMARPAARADPRRHRLDGHAWTPNRSRTSPPSCRRPSRCTSSTTTAGIVTHWRSLPMASREPGTGCRRGWLGFRRGVTPRAVPPLPARDVRRGHRPGPRHRAAARRAGEQPGQPRLPLLRPARLRQDHVRAHPGPRAQLRAGADRRPVRRVRQLPRPGSRRPGLDRRDRDRRGLPRRRRRRPRPAREGVLRPGARAATRSTSSTRPTWSPRRASTPCSSSSRSRRRTCGSSSPPPSPRRCSPTIRSRTHHYPFRLIPPRLLSTYLAELCEREGVADRAGRAAAGRARRAAARRATRSRCSTSCSAAPARTGVTYALATGLLGYTPDSLLDEVVDAFAAGDGAGGLRGGRQGDRDRPGPAALRRGPAPPAARPGDRRRGARRPGHRADRRLRGPGRAAGRPGRPVRRGRAQPGPPTWSPPG